MSSEAGMLAKRRAIATLDTVAMGALGVVAAYQLGWVERIPEPGPFDSPKVVGSKDAYRYFGIPDGLLGIASYAVTATLALAGPPDRAKTMPWLSVAMAGKVFLDAGQAGRLAVSEWTKYRAFCLYCLIAAGATFATVPLVFSESKAALARLR